MKQLLMAAGFLTSTLAALAGFAIGSEEEHLIANEIRIAFPERKDTGKVVFSAKLTDGVYESITIEAFGKSHEVAKEMLDQLKDYPIESLRASHEAGYEILGGHTVYFRFTRRDFMTRRPREVTLILAVSKGKGLELRRDSQKPADKAN